MDIKKNQENQESYMISSVSIHSVEPEFMHGPSSHAVEAILGDESETSLWTILCFVKKKLFILLTSPSSTLCRSLNSLPFLILLLQFCVEIETLHVGFLKDFYPCVRIPINITFSDIIHWILKHWLSIDPVEKIVENNFWVCGTKNNTGWQVIHG